MSGRFVRILVCLLLCSVVAACGGGGGGGGGKKTPTPSAAPVDTDGDTHPDSQDAFPNDPKEWADSDKDGVGNNSDAFPNDASETLDTDKDGVGNNKDQFPNDASETVDTDKDGVGDNADVFPNDASETLDSDKDGVGDNKDQFPTLATESVDTDKDGVGDNADAFPKDASETLDTDKDGVGNNKDLFPNDATETVDTDKDGVGDNSDPSPMGQPIPAWTTYQGDAKHTGRVDIMLDTSNFKQRWNKLLPLTTSQPGAAGDGYIFFNNAGVLYAVDARSGETRWTQTLPAKYSLNIYNQPAYADGIVYVQTGGYSDAFLWAFNAVDGALVFQSPLNDLDDSFYAPTIVDGTVYIGGGNYGGMYAFDAKTGQEKWWQTLGQFDQFTPAVSGNYAIAYTGGYSPQLTVADRLTGNVSFGIADPGFIGSGWNGGSMHLAPVVAGDYVLANYNGRLVAFNLASKQLVWELKPGFSSQPVVKGDRFFIINNGVLETRTIVDGALVSSISGSTGFIGNPLVTNNLLFIRDVQNTYAYQLDTGARAWTLAGKSGGFLMAEGALVIFTASGVVTIDLEGDIDADGLPDWWEKRLKKNIDPAADADNDGLTALQEFIKFTNPFVADTDGDGLLDGEEVTGGKTSPLKVDTDGDGLSDGLEVKTHLTDPTKADSDGDSLTDAEEIAAGLNPLDGKDSLGDSDGDGYSNLHELRANTAINDPAAHPQARDWAMQTGNAQRNSYSPVLLNDTKFSERWTISSYRDLHGAVTAADKLILQTSTNQIVAWDAGTGAESWHLSGLPESVGPASTTTGKMAYFARTSGNSYEFHVVDTANGASLTNNFVGYYGYDSTAPLLDDEALYYPDINNGTFNAFSLSTGNLLWTSALGNVYYESSDRHLLGNGQLIAFKYNSLNIFSTTNGALVKDIALTGNRGVNKTALGTKGNVIIQDGDGILSSVSLDTGKRSWTNLMCPSGKFAVGNGQVYALANNKLCVIDEQSGALSWSLEVPYVWGSSNLVLTASHLFYSDGASTRSVNLASKSVAWSIAKGATNLALGADGTLYLQSAYSVTAVDTEGDTDSDGLLQWWERRYGGDLVATADGDGDGLTNLEEFANKTNPLVADTDGDGLNDGREVNTTKTNPLLADSDKDGLSDGAEVNTHHTNPLLADSDADGIDDAREITLGLDPMDKDDATADSDSDGFSNSDEIFSGTNFNDASDKPVVGDWAMPQGNAMRNGFQAYRFNEDNFGLRWSKTFSLDIQPVVTGDNHVFVTQGNYETKTLFSLDAVDGKQEWAQRLKQSNSATAISYDLGRKVMVQDDSNTAALLRFAADQGTAAAKVILNGYNFSYRTPSVLGNTAYTVTGEGFIATNLDSGANLWGVTIPTHGSYIALNGQHLFYGKGTQIFALDRATGAQAFSIDTQSAVDMPLVLGAHNTILTYQNGLSSFDLSSRKQNWHIPGNNYDGGTLPVVANGQVYHVGSGVLSSVDELNGSPRWSWRPDGQNLGSNIIATLSHVFVASETKTFALSATTGELLWSYDAGGRLALGADGALYIQSGQRLVAINLEGDSDSDGMPDWWERHYGLNVNDGSDAALDLDSDGLTNLAEFTHHTYADKSDSDGDSLDDEEEVNSLLTDPTRADSDGDGMDDGWEHSNNLNPLSAADRDTDTDGDTVPNYFEYLEATDPNNALALPNMFSAGVYSFEDGRLPAGWHLSDDTVNTSVVSNNFSDGSKALEMRGKAAVNFEGFFAASDLSLDVKSYCNYSAVEVYIDDQLMTTFYGNFQRTTFKTLIPMGQHKVSISGNYSCEVYLDKVVIEAAKTNTQLGLQFVGLNSNQLLFVDADETVARSLWVQSPLQNLSVQGLATVGNEKVVVAFSGNETHVGLLDLATFNWRYFEGLNPLNTSYWSGFQKMAAKGNFAYLATRDALGYSGKISRLDLTSGAITQFGSHLYTSIALDNAGFIYAYSDGTVYKYDPDSLTLDSQSKIIDANQILVDNEGRLIAANASEIVRYNAQRLVDARIKLTYSTSSIAVNERNELLVANQNGAVIRYAANWQQSNSLEIPSLYQLASFPQLDSDSDAMPDWWELRYGLDKTDAADAATDSDSDGLTALEEFTADTNPAVGDTDADGLTDGKEVTDLGTNPNKADTDADGLSDGEEVNRLPTDPLRADTDGDLVNDFLEINHFLTDPNDAASKPATLANFVESFENTINWKKPAQAVAGWTVVADVASNGSKSLRAEATNSSDKFAQIEWYAVFGQSTLTFDAKISNNCCGYLFVYVDGVQKLYLFGYGEWQTYTLQLSAGFHTIRFDYQSYYYYGSSSESAWIDNIRVQ